MQATIAISYHQTPAYAKPLILSGSAAILASAVAAVAVVVFAAAMVVFALPIAATTAVAGVICLAVGLAALNKKHIRHVSPQHIIAEVKAFVRSNRLPLANQRLRVLPLEHQKHAMDEFVQILLETPHDGFSWLVINNRDIFTPVERQALFKKWIERKTTTYPIEGFLRLINVLHLDKSDVKPLIHHLCKTYVEQGKPEAVQQLAKDWNLHL